MEDKSITEEKEDNDGGQRQSQKDRNGIFSGVVFGTVFLFVSWLVYEKAFDYLIGKILLSIVGFLAFLCYAVALSCYFDYKSSKKVEEMNDNARAEERELSNYNPENSALRAEKIYRVNQKELMRYYDMNIAQTKFLSRLGIIMILFGILIVIVTILTYMKLKADVMFLCVGNVSGILVDFIGAIFIKMYTKNIEAAVLFHAKFAESNNLLLANSIANNIKSNELREETLSDISKGIALLGYQNRQLRNSEE